MRLPLLWENLESDFPSLSPEQLAELDEREARYRRDPDAVIPWEAVKADLKKRP
jgi:putative addiction module component (TIGR02574 family)